jgi:site-specific recombinase XerD
LRERGIASPPSHISRRDPIDPLLSEWLIFLRQHRGLAEATITNYRRYIRRFLEGIHSDGTAAHLATVELTTLRSYVSTIAAAYGRARRRLLVTTLRQFLGYAQDQGYLTRDLRLALDRVPAFKQEDYPHGPAWKDVLRLLDVPDRATPHGRRDYAVLLLLLTYGVRACQLAALTLDDIDWRTMQLKFPPAKGGRPITCPLPQPVGRALMAYLHDRHPAVPDRHLFLSLLAPKRALRSDRISMTVARAFCLAHVASPHRGSNALRHAWATRMLAQGRSLKVIADLLGHRQIETTRIYTKVDVNQLRKVALPWPSTQKEEVPA